MNFKLLSQWSGNSVIDCEILSLKFLLGAALVITRAVRQYTHPSIFIEINNRLIYIFLRSIIKFPRSTSSYET